MHRVLVPGSHVHATHINAGSSDLWPALVWEAADFFIRGDDADKGSNVCVVVETPFVYPYT